MKVNLSKANRVPLVLEYIKTSSNVENPVTISWTIVNVDRTFEHSFRKATTNQVTKISKTNWKKYIANSKVERDKKLTKSIFSTVINNTRQSMLQRTYDNFATNVTNRTYEIFYNLNYKSKYLIYVMECTLYDVHNVGKSETSFNLMLWPKNHL